jgi:hypothetical protein
MGGFRVLCLSMFFFLAVAPVVRAGDNAASECFFSGGMAWAKYRNGHRQQVERLLENRFIGGGLLSADYSSQPKALGGGCSWKYVDVEIDYFQGMRATDLWEIHGEIGIEDIVMYTTPSLFLRRHAEVRGFRPSVMFKYLFTERTAAFLQVGAIIGELRMELELPQVSRDYRISYTKRDTAPLLGIGLQHRFTPCVMGLAEYEKFDKYSELAWIRFRRYVGGRCS